MLMAVNEPYALMVQPDDILISPREVDEHFGTMVCFHPRYALGDHHNHMDKDDFLREMYLDTVGHDEAGMKRYERMVNIVSSRFRHGPKTEERAIDEAMQKVISEKYLMLPLYLYDHSGLAMSTESFSGRAPHAEWDSGQVGWIYVSKEDALKEFDADKMTGAIRQKADALMRSEVAAYDSYLRGECYGFELYKNGELSDSCWGFMGNFSDVLKDMPEDAERKGLGTPATRAATLEKLVSAGFVQRKKKQLIPTEKGKNLIAVLPDNIKSPILTAEWESMLKQVEHGELSATSFMDQIADMSRTLVKEHTTPEERFADLFPSSRGTAHEAVGVCPRCGAPVYEGKKGFFCDNRECSFALWKDNRFFSSKKKSITKSVAAALLKEGRISMSGLYSEKTGKTYDAEVILDDTGGKYVNFKLEFPVKKGRRK